MNRRQFIQRVVQGSLVSASGLSILPSLAMNATSTRRFLFVFCDGAWDTSMVFAPEMLQNYYVHTGSDDVETNLGGFSFVDNSNRPEVRRFFEQWADQCLVINGLDFETVAHDRAKRILMTGSPVGTDDWGAIIGAHAPQMYTAPHLLLSGPNYATQFSNAILRVGEDGELSRLLSGQDRLSITPTRDHEDLVSKYLRQRTEDTIAVNPRAENFLYVYRPSIPSIETPISLPGI